MVDRLMTQLLLVDGVAGSRTIVIEIVVLDVSALVALLIPLSSCVLILWGCPPKTMCLPKVSKL